MNRDFVVIAYSLADKKPPFPHVKIDDLSEEMQSLVGKFVFLFLEERDKRSRNDTDAWCYWAALQELGIDCPHPISMRVPLPNNHAEGFECVACKEWVIKIARSQESLSI